MLRAPNVPLLCRSMGSTSNIGLSYSSSHNNLIGRDGSEGLIDDDGVHRYTTASGLTESTQTESHQDRVLQRFRNLMAVKANTDAELRELQDQYPELQYAQAQQSSHLPFTTSTPAPVPYAPFTTISPYSTTDNFPNPFGHTVDFSPRQGETLSIPNYIPPPSESQLSTTADVQPATPPLPKYKIRNRAGKKVFRCECGHEASRKGDMKRHHESLEHAKRSYVCPICGKSYTRKDGLLRHATSQAHTLDSHVFDSSY